MSARDIIGKLHKLQPRRLQSLDDRLGDTLHDVVAKRWIIVALLAQAGAIEL
jgi:hypothetical protein